MLRYFIQFFLGVSVALLPFAHLKVIFFGLPLYSVELPVLIASLFYAYGWKVRVFFPFKSISFHSPFLIGIALFVCGAFLSFVLNPFSLSGLGMLKTWFVVPLLALFLWIETKPDCLSLERMLLLWSATSFFAACASLLFYFSGSLTYDGRLAAWYASPNYLAFLLAPGIILLSHFLLHPPLSFLKKKYFRSLSFFTLPPLAFALFLTRSYETWIALSLALLFLFFWGGSAPSSSRKKIIFGMFLTSVLLLFVFFESGSEKWQSLTTQSPRSSLASRAMIWEAATRIISDHPVAGIGIGRFQETYLAYQKYFPPYLEWAVPQPHNLYLALWLETGLLGLFGFLLLTCVWLQKMSEYFRSRVSSETKRLSALLSSLLLFFLILGLADTPFFKTDLAFMFWFILAFGVGLLQSTSVPE